MCIMGWVGEYINGLGHTYAIYRTMHVSRSKTNIELCDHNYSQQRCPDLIKHAFYVYNYGWGRYSEVWGVRSGVGGI